MNRPLARYAGPFLAALTALLLTRGLGTAVDVAAADGHAAATRLRAHDASCCVPRRPSRCAAFVPEAVGRNAAIILDTVTIRVYDSAGVTPRDRTAALKTAGTILSRADLEATWIVCTPARDGKPQPGCDAAPASHELVVRLTYSSPTAEDGNSRAFGYSLIDATTATGTLSTVFVDRVDWLAVHRQGGACRRARARHRARDRSPDSGLQRSQPARPDARDVDRRGADAQPSRGLAVLARTARRRCTRAGLAGAWGAARRHTRPPLRLRQRIAENALSAR